MAPQYEHFFTFQVKSSWWKQYYNPEEISLKKLWQENLKSKFRELKPDGCNCALATEKYNLVHHSSRKYNSTNAFKGYFQCISKVCSRRYRLKILSHPEETDEDITVFVESSGEHKHSSQHPVREQIRGSERKALQEELRSTRPKTLKRKLLTTKLSDPRGKADLDAGNFTGAPTSQSLKQMAYLDRKGERLDDDVFTDIVMHADVLEEKYGKQSIFLRSQRPFILAWSTDRMLIHLQKESQCKRPLVAHFDATGSEVKAVGWANDKPVYTYNFIHKRDKKDSPPIPFLTFLSNDHHDFQISKCLGGLKQRYTELTHSKRMPVDAVVVDLSWANTNAVLEQFCGIPDVVQYMRACVEAKQKRAVKFVLLCWCYTHFINAIKMKASRSVPLSTKPFSPARKFCKNIMAAMARTTDIQQALDIFRLAVVILESKYFTDFVRRAVGSIAIRLGAHEQDVISENFSEEDIIPTQEEFLFPADNRVSEYAHETYSSSPFYKIFYDCYTSAIEEMKDNEASENIKNLKTNPLYVSGFIEYLLQYLLPYYSLWSRYLQCLLLPNKENPLTNSSVELMMRLDKEETLEKKKYQPARVVMVDMVTETERRIDEAIYDTNFRSYQRRVQVEKSPVKKPAVETWKRKRGARQPGGLYSGKATAVYGEELLPKILRAVERQPKKKATSTKDDDANTTCSQSTQEELETKEPEPEQINGVLWFQIKGSQNHFYSLSDDCVIVKTLDQIAAEGYPLMELPPRTPTLTSHSAPGPGTPQASATP